MTPRHLALDILQAVIDDGLSLSAAAPPRLNKITDSRDRSLTYRLVLDTLRQLNRFMWMRDQLLARPLKGQDQDIALLLVLGIAQLSHTDLPSHASIHETVEVARQLKKKWAVALTNGILREFQRQQANLNQQADEQPSLKFSHPRWFIDAVSHAYPSQWQTLLEANNLPARLCLRLKPDVDREHFLEQLPPTLNAIPITDLPQALLIDSTDVTRLFGYDNGLFSVQDSHAQWAGHLLQPKAQERILDACAAPGGKTTHLIELSHQQANITAMDIEPNRVARIEENLKRLQLEAHLLINDAAQPDQWWNGEYFDAILLDAPCSATGIIRRHPDIKWHRKPHDIPQLNQSQTKLLSALWPLLKPGGRLLYATCSVLPAENSQQTQTFLTNTTNARLISVQIPKGIDTGYGIQLLPTDPDSGDGFFYALFEKL